MKNLVKMALLVVFLVLIAVPVVASQTIDMVGYSVPPAGFVIQIGGDVIQLIGGDDFTRYEYSLSPNGEWLVYRHAYLFSNPELAGIWLMNLNTGQEYQLTDNMLDQAAKVSYDGTKVVISRSRSCLVLVDIIDPENLVTNTIWGPGGEEQLNPVWAPNNEIFYSSSLVGIGGGHSLRKLNVSSGVRTTILETPRVWYTPCSVSWDNRKLAYNAFYYDYPEKEGIWCGTLTRTGICSKKFISSGWNAAWSINNRDLYVTMTSPEGVPSLYLVNTKSPRKTFFYATGINASVAQ